jgi:hypothetical protein
MDWAKLSTLPENPVRDIWSNEKRRILGDLALDPGVADIVVSASEPPTEGLWTEGRRLDLDE